MSEFQYYSTITPTEGELVLVVFTEKTDSFFDANLVEYPYRGMMNYSDASKKRKVSSWNKIVPLDKPMVARVDNVDTKAKIVGLSIAYLDDYVEEKNLSPAEIQEKLMTQFTENKLLESLITSVCTISNEKFSNIWTKLVHTIDFERREFNDDSEEDPINLWQYFKANFDEKIDEWCALGEVSEEIRNLIKGLVAKKTEKPPRKITSVISILSQEGISSTKKLFETCLSQTVKCEYSLRYLGAPSFIFETSSADSSQEVHYQFIECLNEQIGVLGLSSVFVQTNPDSVAQIAD